MQETNKHNNTTGKNPKNAPTVTTAKKKDTQYKSAEPELETTNKKITNNLKTDLNTFSLRDPGHPIETPQYMNLHATTVTNRDTPNKIAETNFTAHNAKLQDTAQIPVDSPGLKNKIVQHNNSQPTEISNKT